MDAKQRPPLSDWRSASQKGVEVRQARAAAKKAICEQPYKILQFLKEGRENPEGCLSNMRVSELLGALPGVGEVKTRRIMQELGIAASKRLSGMGPLQCERLKNYLESRSDILKTRRSGSSGTSTRLTIVAGPTAVGKGTVISVLRKKHPQVMLSVSATTRPPRKGEREGIDYYFVGDATFDEMIANGRLLEWATVHKDRRYGTPRAVVENALRKGRQIILEIDVQGARQVKKLLPDSRTVFIMPPAWEDLVKRIKHRGTESPGEMEVRLATAKKEIDSRSEFDQVIVNLDAEVAADELWEIMQKN